MMVPRTSDLNRLDNQRSRFSTNISVEFKRRGKRWKYFPQASPQRFETHRHLCGRLFQPSRIPPVRVIRPVENSVRDDLRGHGLGPRDPLGPELSPSDTDNAGAGPKIDPQRPGHGGCWWQSLRLRPSGRSCRVRFGTVVSNKTRPAIT
jgi:hypothetical protein